MRNPTRRQSRGQILLIVAVGMMVLLGIGALVVDLGFSWMLRRQEQNAADPAALAAARFIRDPDPGTGLQTYDDVQGWNAACHYARANGFFAPGNTACTPETNGTTMEVNWPPKGTVADFWHGDLGHVQVIISSQHDTFFGRIFGKSTATVTTGAVAARQRGNTNSHSLISLKPDGCGNAEIRGNSTITVYPAPGYSGDGGYVQINSDCGGNVLDDDCSNAPGALDINGTATLLAPRVNVHGGCSGPADQPLLPSILDEAARQLGDPLAGLHFPSWDTSLAGAKCGQTGASTTAAGSEGCGNPGGLAWKFSADADCPGLPATFKCVELDPGIYYGGWEIDTKIRVNLKPGIYVLAGGGITIKSSGSLDSLADVTSIAPVLIYSTDNPLFRNTCPSAGTYKCQGNLDMTASGDLKLAGLRADQPCPPVTTSGGCPFGGMVIWFDGAGSKPAPTTGNPSCANFACVDIEGGVNLSISGTIYAPRAHVDITGNAQTNCDATATQVAAVQLITWTWDLGGTGDICMPYDPTKLYKFQGQGLVH